RAVEQRQPPGKTAVKRGDEILFLCPAHDDHEPSASWNPAKGVWHCHACAAGGGAKDLALLLGIEWVNGKVTIEKPSLDAFAADRCIDPGSWQRMSEIVR
ncbi:MAG: hypothetical protein IT307_14120, partial [Chloroflexi bacterium]|nr:hypothetical protein [Chloroflexota bacterium]